MVQNAKLYVLTVRHLNVYSMTREGGGSIQEHSLAPIDVEGCIVSVPPSVGMVGAMRRRRRCEKSIFGISRRDQGLEKYTMSWDRY